MEKNMVGKNNKQKNEKNMWLCHDVLRVQILD